MQSETNEEWERNQLVSKSTLLANYAETVAVRNMPLDTGLLHLLRSCEQKIIYSPNKEAFHKQFRQMDVTGDANIDMAIWWLLVGAERFWRVFDGMVEVKNAI